MQQAEKRSGTNRADSLKIAYTYILYHVYVYIAGTTADVYEPPVDVRATCCARCSVALCQQKMAIYTRKLSVYLHRYIAQMEHSSIIHLWFHCGAIYLTIVLLYCNKYSYPRFVAFSHYVRIPCFSSQKSSQNDRLYLDGITSTFVLSIESRNFYYKTQNRCQFLGWFICGRGKTPRRKVLVSNAR